MTVGLGLDVRCVATERIKVSGLALPDDSNERISESSQKSVSAAQGIISSTHAEATVVFEMQNLDLTGFVDFVGLASVPVSSTQRS